MREVYNAYASHLFEIIMSTQNKIKYNPKYNEFQNYSHRTKFQGD